MSPRPDFQARAASVHVLPSDSGDSAVRIHPSRTCEAEPLCACASLLEMVFILILGIFSGEIIALLGDKKSSPNPSLILPRVSPPYHGICLPCSILSSFLADSTESLLQYKYYLCFSAFPKLPACELPWINQHRV